VPAGTEEGTFIAAGSNTYTGAQKLFDTETCEYEDMAPFTLTFTDSNIMVLSDEYAAPISSTLTRVSNTP
jgi:hypothetical protein